MPNEALNTIARIIDREVIQGGIKDQSGQIDRVKAHELQLKLLQLTFLERIATSLEILSEDTPPTLLAKVPEKQPQYTNTTTTTSNRKSAKEKQRSKPIKESEPIEELADIGISNDLE